ncbi:hypothetical protein WA158_003142 [Blastocystis sp. Blastoise]
MEVEPSTADMPEETHLRSFKIQMLHSDQYVEIFEDELPDDPKEIIGLMVNEMAPLKIWIQIAAEYWKQKKYTQFKTMLTQVSGDNLPPVLSNQYEERVTILNYLTFYEIQFCNDINTENAIINDLMRRSEILAQADPRLLSSIFIIKGIYRYKKGDYGKASEAFNAGLKEDRYSISALVGIGLISLNNGKYEDARKAFKTALIQYPEASADLRLCMGLSFYYLNKYDYALLCIDRALEIDPSNAYAFVFKSILYKNREDIDIFSRTHEAMNYLKEAYIHNPSLPLTLYHLAEHYLYSWKQIPNIAAKMVPNSNIVSVEKDLRDTIKRGDSIKIGTEIYTVKDINENSITLNTVFIGETEEDSLVIYTHEYNLVLELCNRGLSSESISNKTKDDTINMITINTMNKTKDTNNNTTSIDLLSGDIYELMGRVYMLLNDKSNAKEYFEYSLQKNKNNILAKFGLALIYLNIASTTSNKGRKLRYRADAKRLLQEVHRSDTKCVDCSYQICLLYIKENQFKLARQIVQEIIDLDGSYINAYILRGYILQNESNINDKKQALRDYEDATKMKLYKGETVEAGIWNNVGVLRYILEKYEDALTAFHECIKINNINHNNTSTNPDEYMYTNYNITYTYNIACIYRSMCLFDKSKEIFTKIIKAFPLYLEVYICLGKEEEKRGRYKEASEYYGTCVGLCEQNMPKNFDTALPTLDRYYIDHWTSALSLLTNIYINQNKYEQGLSVFNRIFRKYSNYKDEYISLQQAQLLYLCTSTSLLTNTTIDIPQAMNTKNYQKIYTDIIERHNNNTFAANGLGVIAAEQNRLNLADRIFNSIRECAYTNFDSSINLGTVCIYQNDYSNAIRLFESIKKQSTYFCDSNIYLLTGFAYYLANLFNDSIRTLQKGLFLDPSNLVLWYDLAISSESNYISILKKGQPFHPKPFDSIKQYYTCCRGKENSRGCRITGNYTRFDIEQAQNYLNFCNRLYQKLSSISIIPVDRKSIESHMEYCKGQDPVCKQYLEREIQKEQAYKDVMNKANIPANSITARMLEEQEKQKEKEKEELERTKAIANRYKQELGSIIDQLKYVPPEKKVKKSKKAMDEFIEQNDQNDMDIGQRIDAEFADSEDESININHETEKKPKKRVYDSDDDEEEEGEKKKKKRNRLRSNRNIQEDKEDEDEDEDGFEIDNEEQPTSHTNIETQDIEHVNEDINNIFEDDDDLDNELNDTNEEEEEEKKEKEGTQINTISNTNSSDIQTTSQSTNNDNNNNLDDLFEDDEDL